MSSLGAATLYDLKGRIALVTGGGTGIGLMIAQGLAANGAKVYITGRRQDVLDKIASTWKGSGSIIALNMDASSKESITKARDIVSQKDGKLHVLVNNAGQVGPRSPFMNEPTPLAKKNGAEFGQVLFDNESIEAWSDLYIINTFSMFFVTTAFLGLLEKGSADIEGYTSSVINITSISGITKLAQSHLCYNSSKAAGSHLTKMLATEFALKGIPVRVNSIAPGVFESEMTESNIEGEEATNAVGQSIFSVPAKRSGTTGEMAGTALYLASATSGYMTGQEIVIDGGYLAVNP